MKITRYAHACLLVEEGSTRLLIDPGTWNETPDATGVHAVLITHEHQDHCAVDQLTEIAARNPGVVVITHAAVAALLADTGLTINVIEEGGTLTVEDVTVQSFGHEHAVVYGSSPCRNTGFLINNALFVPGDALHDVPTVPVHALALPTGGPWMKLGEAIDYLKVVRPAIAFPIHDAMHTEDYKREFIPMVINRNLADTGLTFTDVQEGGVIEV